VRAGPGGGRGTQDPMALPPSAPRQAEGEPGRRIGTSRDEDEGDDDDSKGGLGWLWWWWREGVRWG
jgi:hypothetical protein